MSERAVVLRVVSRSRLIDVRAEATDGREVTYHLSVDGTERAAVTALRSYPPGLTVGDSRIALWAERSIAAVDLSTERVAHWDQVGVGDIAAVYCRDDYWIVVTELATTAWTANFGRQLGEYDHRDVVVDLTWEGDDLVVGDYAGDVARLRGCRLERV